MNIHQSVAINSKIFERHGKNQLTTNFSPEEIYGKTLTFQINELQTGKSSEETAEEIEIYIPKKLHVSNPPAPEGNRITTVAYYKNFVLEWNADPENKEGLMVAVEFNGERVNMNQNSETPRRIVDHIEVDNGKYILNEAMFDGIPNLSFVDIILLRGNVKVNEFNGETYKTYGESHQRIPILLVKDLKTVLPIE